MPRVMKTVLAFAAMLVALVVGIPLMLQGESRINPNEIENISQMYGMSAEAIRMRMPEVMSMVDDGMKPYFFGIGLIFALVAVAYVLVDGEDQVATLKGTEQEEG